MSLWHIAWSYLWNRKLTTCLTIFSVALGVGLIFCVLALREETRKRFEDEGQAFDIVVGPKGSPLQLVLSSVYFMDSATGAINMNDYEAIKKHEDVESAFPIALGDTYRGMRIVGTVRELFDYTWTSASTGEKRQPFVLKEGRYFEKNMEAVIGASVAEAFDLKLGDTFAGSHAMVQLSDYGVDDGHAEKIYTVVGILQNSGSPSDRAIFTPMDSVWEVHEHTDKEEEVNEIAPGRVSAILVCLQSPALRFQFQEYVNTNMNAMATVPIQQIANLYLSILSTAKSVLLTIGYLVVVISAISILVGLYLSIIQRKRDLAIMRALGAAAFEIVGSVLIEAFWVTVLGIASGWVLGNVVCVVIGHYLRMRYGLSISVFRMPTPEELAAFATVALVGIVAGILPAWQAYRTDVARDLAEM